MLQAISQSCLTLVVHTQLFRWAMLAVFLDVSTACLVVFEDATWPETPDALQTQQSAAKIFFGL